MRWIVYIDIQDVLVWIVVVKDMENQSAVRSNGSVPSQNLTRVTLPDAEIIG